MAPEDIRQSDAFDRAAVIERAKTWTSVGVPYSQLGYKDGYRRDCSGFLSMAWNLPENLTTWRVPLVAKEIKKSELLPGDVLLDATSGAGGRHVVIFEKWADSAKQKYWVLESTGQDGVERAIRRVVPYPYRVNKARYKPYRFVSMDGYWPRMPVGHLQPVEGYRGPVQTPIVVLTAMRLDAEQRAEAARSASKPQPVAESKALAVKAEAERRIAAQRKAEEVRVAAEKKSEAQRLAAAASAEAARLATAASSAVDRFRNAWAQADRRRNAQREVERQARVAESAPLAAADATSTVDLVSRTETVTALLVTVEETQTTMPSSLEDTASAVVENGEAWRLLAGYDSRAAAGQGLVPAPRLLP
jgi:hypothetical protein